MKKAKELVIEEQIPQDLKRLAETHLVLDTALKLINTGMYQRGHLPHLEVAVQGLVPMIEDIARQSHAHPQCDLVLKKPDEPEQEDDIQPISETVQ